ncbi:hypothetical protein BDV35DRAFT_385018 [Aspergillus flavus]|uniref:Secreted protein n=1 Tax=Aspergillus flavus TaxID=5059 RepID=A0A5N6GIY2_ASPFL|nr:hypothetical protein BDV35DRAFT_385018 [Aspergillus flavus]
MVCIRASQVLSVQIAFLGVLLTQPKLLMRAQPTFLSHDHSRRDHIPRINHDVDTNRGKTRGKTLNLHKNILAFFN